MNIFPSNFTFEDYEKLKTNNNPLITSNDNITHKITNGYVTIYDISNDKQLHVKILFDYRCLNLYYISDDNITNSSIIKLNKYEFINIDDNNDPIYLGDIIIKEFDYDLDKSNLQNFVSQYNSEVNLFLKSTIDYCECKLLDSLNNNKITAKIDEVIESINKELYIENSGAYLLLLYYFSENDNLTREYVKLSQHNKDVACSFLCDKRNSDNLLQDVSELLNQLHLPASIIMENFNISSECEMFICFLIIHISAMIYYSDVWQNQCSIAYNPDKTATYYIKECLLKDKIDVSDSKNVTALMYFLISKRLFKFNEIGKIRKIIKDIAKEVMSRIKFILNVDSVINFINDRYVRSAESIQSAINLLSETLTDCFNNISNHQYVRFEDYNAERLKASMKSTEEDIGNFYNIIAVLNSYAQKFDFDMESTLNQVIEAREGSDEQKELAKKLRRHNIDYNDPKFSLDKNIPHYLNEPDFPHKKPHAYEIKGIKKYVSAWCDLLAGTCSCLYHMNKELFTSFLDDVEINGIEGGILSVDKKSLTQAKLIKGSGIYVKGNIGAKACDIIMKMLQRFDIPITEYKIYLNKDFSSLWSKNKDDDDIQTIQTDDTIYRLQFDFGDAYGKQTGQGSKFIVLKGSHIHTHTKYKRPLPAFIKSKVDESRKNGEIIDGSLQNDKIFEHHTYAAQFITGCGEVDYLACWKNSKGEILKYRRTTV